MGKVYTTSEDLTSIANAIRAKAGTNSNLVYPTGFVSGIQGIEGDTWDGFGANPEFVQTIYTSSITLADTNWKNVTISTEGTTIKEREAIIDSANETNIMLNINYDYYIQGLGKINYTYQPGTTISKGILKCYYGFFTSITGINYNYDDILLNNLNTITTESSSNTRIIYLNNSQTLKSIRSNSGINSGIYFYMYTNPSISASQGIYKLYTPRIQICSSQTYMTPEMIDKLDEDNTTIEFIYKLYKYKKLSTITAVKNKIIDDQARQDFASQ